MVGMIVKAGSGVVVGKADGQRTMRLDLLQQGARLLLGRLHRIGARHPAQRGVLLSASWISPRASFPGSLVCMISPWITMPALLTSTYGPSKQSTVAAIAGAAVSFFDVSPTG